MGSLSDFVSSGGGTPTGAVSQYIGTTEPSGWLLLQGGTIGNASSGGTARANADTEDLFGLLWESMANAQAAVSGGRGGSAAADFAANKTITLPDMRGRAAIGTGQGATLTDRTHGDTGGAETHTLTVAEMPAHSHSITTWSASVIANSIQGGNPAGTMSAATTDSTGGGASHNNMQPWLALNHIIKL